MNHDPVLLQLDDAELMRWIIQKFPCSNDSECNNPCFHGCGMEGNTERVKWLLQELINWRTYFATQPGLCRMMTDGVVNTKVMKKMIAEAMPPQHAPAAPVPALAPGFIGLNLMIAGARKGVIFLSVSRVGYVISRGDESTIAIANGGTRYDVEESAEEVLRRIGQALRSTDGAA